jgi:hypothetical protein
MLSARFRRPAALFLTSLICVLLPSLASASHSWGGYHWHSDNSAPITIRIVDNLTGAWNTGYLNPVASKWGLGYNNQNDPPNIPSAVTLAPENGTLSNVRKCSAITGTVQVCNTTYGNNGWLGVAQIWISGGHITKGSVKLNDTYFNTAKYNTTAWRNLVLCQEVGHTFGLDHQDENFSNGNLGTCMDYTNDPESNQWPNKHDFEQLRDIYAHLPDVSASNTFSTGSGKMPPGMSRDLHEPSEWGKLVRESQGGRNAVYERDFGGGHQVFTFVIWAR